MTFRIVVVCSANVCRSPMAAALLRQSLEGTALQDEVEVSSCGEHAWRGSQLCDELVPDGKLGVVEREAREDHVPTQLEPALLVSADLVLTSDRAVRSSVARMAPAVHDRTFTLREAAALADHVVRMTAAAGYDDLAWLSTLVTEMNDSRGLIPMPGTASYPRRHLPWPRLTVHDHDVPDPHDDGRVPHRVAGELLVDACARLATAFRAAMPSESGPAAPWWWS